MLSHLVRPSTRYLIRLSSLHCHRSYSSQSSCPPLRILFCGSDTFSTTALSRLHSSQRTRTLPIDSIEVLCRPPKRTGRGLKVIAEVPVAAHARDLGLPVHQIDSFDGWNLPEGRGINLIVAVSFGLLIPGRLIEGARYGGLNVHPSVLPDFRGAAPIERALLAGQRWTGVTLQTLHPTRFDAGVLLRRALYEIGPIGERLEEALDGDVSSKHEATGPRVDTDPPTDVVTHYRRLASLGAEELFQGLKSGVVSQRDVKGIEPLEKHPDGTPVQQRKAPKMSSEDRHADFERWTGKQYLLRQWLLGPLWANMHYETSSGPMSARIKFKAGTWHRESSFGDQEHPHETAGTLAVRSHARPAARGVRSDGTFIEISMPMMPDSREHRWFRIERMTLPGKKEQSTEQALKSLKITDLSSICFT